MSPTNDPIYQPEARTVIGQKISRWQFANEYILSGYRPANADYLKTLRSLKFLHNESCNVYTHLIGALLLPLFATTLLRYLAEPKFLNVSTWDYAVFGIYFWCSEVCLILSTLYHLMQSHSYQIEQFWHGMDLLGIVFMTVGTLFSGIYYVFFCEASWQKLHWAMVLATGSVTGILISNPLLKTPRWRNIKIGTFIIFGASSFIPLLHGVQRYGLDYMLQYSGIRWYLLELTFYGAGVGLYTFQIPERLVPGKFDIWGSSHQIFHVAILCAIYAHHTALLHGFTTCHTLDHPFSRSVFALLLLIQNTSRFHATLLLSKLWSTVTGRYPRFLRCYIRYTLQGGVQRYGLEYMLCDSGVMWYLLKICLYGIRVSVYAIGLQAYRVRQKITNIHFNQSADFQSIWYQGDWIPGRGHIRSLMLLVYAQRIHAKSL